MATCKRDGLEIVIECGRLLDELSTDHMSPEQAARAEELRGDIEAYLATFGDVARYVESRKRATQEPR